MADPSTKPVTVNPTLEVGPSSEPVTPTANPILEDLAGSQSAPVPKTASPVTNPVTPTRSPTSVESITSVTSPGDSESVSLLGSTTTGSKTPSDKELRTNQTTDEIQLELSRLPIGFVNRSIEYMKKRAWIITMLSIVGVGLSVMAAITYYNDIAAYFRIICLVSAVISCACIASFGADAYSYHSGVIYRRKKLEGRLVVNLESTPQSVEVAEPNLETSEGRLLTESTSQRTSEVKSEAESSSAGPEVDNESVRRRHRSAEEGKETTAG